MKSVFERLKISRQNLKGALFLLTRLIESLNFQARTTLTDNVYLNSEIMDIVLFIFCTYLIWYHFYFLFSFFRFGIASSSILGVACAFWAALVTIKAFGLALISLIEGLPSGLASSSQRAGHSAFSALRFTCQKWRFGEMNFEWVNFALESSSVRSEAFS